MLLDDAADREGCRDSDRERPGRDADAGTDDDARERLQHGQEDDERDGAEEVDDEVDHRVHRAVGQHAAGPGRVGGDPDDEAEHAAEHQRERRHVERLDGCLPEVALKFDEAIHQRASPSVNSGPSADSGPSEMSVTVACARIRVRTASIAASDPLIARVRCPKARPRMSLMPP